MVGDEPAPSELLRPAEPGLSLTAPPGRGTPVPGLTAAPACLAASPRRDAAPPMHRWAACFICCMMSLLFSYLLFAPGNPTASYFVHRQSVALIPYIPRTLIRCKSPGFTIAKRRDTYRYRPISVVPPQETKWTHAPLSGHESRCCSFCNKRAKRRSMWARNGADCSRLPHVPDPASATSQGDLQTSCLAAYSVRQAGSAGPPEPAQSRRSRLPLVRPSRSLLRAPPGTRPRRTTRGRVSRPGGTGCTSRRLTTGAVTVRAVRL